MLHLRFITILIHTMIVNVLKIKYWTNCCLSMIVNVFKMEY